MWVGSVWPGDRLSRWRAWSPWASWSAGRVGAGQPGFGWASTRLRSKAWVRAVAQGQQVGAHVLQVRATVGQHQLRDGQRQQGVVVAAKLVAPAGQDLPESGEFCVDPVAAEHPPAQHQPLEAAETVELAEPAEQEGMRGEVGT